MQAQSQPFLTRLFGGRGLCDTTASLVSSREGRAGLGKLMQELCVWSLGWPKEEQQLLLPLNQLHVS